MMDFIQEEDYGAFTEKFVLAEPFPPPSLSSPPPYLPLQGLTFSVKSIFDVEGHVTSFGNPDWAATHQPAKSTAPAVRAILKAGATCLGITVMDEMAYSINGENLHYGTPRNPYSPDRVPGGSSSGSAVTVASKIVDFSLGTDTGGSVRVPASYCGILGFRPSHGVVTVEGVIPMAQSLDTVGWFARDPVILNRVGRVLLPLPDENVKTPRRLLVADDCFQLSTIPISRVKEVLVKSVKKLFGGDIVKHLMLGDYVKDNVSSLTHFISHGDGSKQNNIPSLAALSSAMSSLQRYEFKNNHQQWITSVNPNLGPGIAERVHNALQKTDDESIDLCRSVMTELGAALTSLLGDYGAIAIPTVPGPPPTLKMEVGALDKFRSRAFGLLSIAGLSGFCQVSIPLGMHDNLPVSLSLLGKHGSDKFLLNLTENIYSTLKEQSEHAMLRS